MDPQFISTTRRWAECDAMLGGVGTTSNVFETVMFNRWTGAPARYTSAQMVDCLRAAWQPTGVDEWKTAMSTKVFVGAMAPVLPGAANLPPQATGPLSITQSTH